MTEAQARLLYEAGGFPISADGKNPTNRCGKAANPRITFVDINRDKRPEALFVDSGACYQPDDRWFALAAQGADGRWRRILEGPGTMQATGVGANGWFEITATSKQGQRKFRYNGSSYVDAAAAASAAAPAAPSASAPIPAPAGAASGDAAIFRAAGLRQVAGQWQGECDATDSPSYEPGSIQQRKDLNGDGRPEAVVMEGSAICYGMTGAHFWLVSQQGDGSWKLVHSGIGLPEFLATKGVGGWPDIEVGGPGFCFPVLRWNGTAYVPNRSQYEGKPCKR